MSESEWSCTEHAGAWLGGEESFFDWAAKEYPGKEAWVCSRQGDLYVYVGDDLPKKLGPFGSLLAFAWTNSSGKVVTTFPSHLKKEP